MNQQFRGTGNQFRNEDEAEIRAREIDELKSEINRLEGELKKANAQTEEFERRWYLVQDTAEELRTQVQGLSNEISDFQNTIERQSVENQKIKGQQSVLIDLLRECLSVLSTIDGDNIDEIELLADLELKCEKAIEGALQ
ncbi:hypothetical protein UFOVP1374_40 [uncultured Caudovirales phage]|uniref:Uncharacterized protein n=1 Tax=uncultured Caudovirales phage TaxID=2100421 RepID=A0A6J5S2U3_9CAUD|nr:hypothetical protein UFOVP1374_40 [uncultured Caudovirales phage]